MKAQGLARLGRDAEMKVTASGEVVASLSLAFSFGKKGNDGNRPTQWVDASFWGKRAEMLTPFLLKGNQVVVYLDDVHIQTYQTRAGAEGSKLAAKVTDIELVAGNQQAQAPAPAPQRQAPAPAPMQRQAAPAAKGASSGFEDMDDDLPFVSASMAYDMTTSKARKMARYDY